MKKYIPNILTTLRIAASVCLLACEPLGVPFVILYIFAGLTDMLDGVAARRLNAASRFGERYDSLADMLFIGVCLFKLLPVLQLSCGQMIWLALIAVIKCVNPVMAYFTRKKVLFLHTKANRVTGFMLFISILLLIWIPVDYLFPVLSAVATFAAMQEGYYIRKEYESEDIENKNVK